MSLLAGLFRNAEATGMHSAGMGAGDARRPIGGGMQTRQTQSSQEPTDARSAVTIRNAMQCPPGSVRLAA